MNANKFAEFHAKILNRSENIHKSLGVGATFLETPCRNPWIVFQKN